MFVSYRRSVDDWDSQFKTKKAKSNAAVTSKANAGMFAAFALKYGGDVETGMARLFLPGKESFHFFKTLKSKLEPKPKPELMPCIRAVSNQLVKSGRHN